MKCYISAFEHEKLLNKQHIYSNAKISYFIHPNLPVTFQTEYNTDPSPNTNCKGLNPKPTVILLQQNAFQRSPEVVTTSPPCDSRHTSAESFLRAVDTVHRFRNYSRILNV